MREQILEIIKQVLELDSVTDNISQDNCEKWDSLNQLNLVLAIEDAFGVSFEPEDIAEMKDVASIEKYINSKK